MNYQFIDVEALRETVKAANELFKTLQTPTFKSQRSYWSPPPKTINRELYTSAQIKQHLNDVQTNSSASLWPQEGHTCTPSIQEH